MTLQEGSVDLNREPSTEAGRKLLARELWEWLPEAYQMSRARLAEDIEEIERQAVKPADTEED